jgi:asparagine synthase (glutamine-hydrolysing)
MCGISGVLSVDGKVDCPALIEAIVASQRARGPDAQVVETYRAEEFELVLGHNRLSIIDLRPEANQPMADSHGDLRVVLNGEIYNYIELRAELLARGATFRTNSDTEVILEAYRAWGVAAFDRFIGMFAFGLYDTRKRELVLVRDRFGVKPLYYLATEHFIAFASTPTALAAWFGLKPNLEYVARGISHKYYEDDRGTAPYEGLKALLPSHLLRVRVEQGRVVAKLDRYYDLRERVQVTRQRLASLGDQAIADEFLELLLSACRLRLRSDVTLGLSVSGGVDSSTIAAVVTPEATDIIGYSFGDPDDPKSEGPLVADLARHVGMRPHYVGVSGEAALEELFWRTLAAQDAPFPSASVMAQQAVFRAARADKTIVLLGGQGGDEAFMGYRKFYLFYVLSILRERRVSALPHLLATVLPLLPAVIKRARVFMGERARYSNEGAGMGTQLILPPVTTAESMSLPENMSVTERQVLDVTRFSLPTLLRYEDRNSMSNSIESRLPFLDQRVIEFGISLAERLKLQRGFGKWIVRDAMAGKLPASIRLNRDKRGFDVNQQGWIRAGLGRVLRGALTERSRKISQWLPPGAVIDRHFSDAALTNGPQAFKEAVSLIWLGDRVS